MKKFTKKIILTKLLAMLLCICFLPVPVFAGENLTVAKESTVTPFNTEISSASCGLSIYYQVASCQAFMAAASQTIDRVEIVAMFQQYKNGSWITLTTFTSVTGGHYGYLNGNCFAPTGYEYRVACIYRAYRAGILQEMMYKTCNYGYYSS